MVYNGSLSHTLISFLLSDTAVLAGWFSVGSGRYLIQRILTIVFHEIVFKQSHSVSILYIYIVVLCHLFFFVHHAVPSTEQSSDFTRITGKECSSCAYETSDETHYQNTLFKYVEVIPIVHRNGYLYK